MCNPILIIVQISQLLEVAYKLINSIIGQKGKKPHLIVCGVLP